MSILSDIEAAMAVYEGYEASLRLRFLEASSSESDEAMKEMDRLSDLLLDVRAEVERLEERRKSRIRIVEEEVKSVVV